MMAAYIFMAGIVLGGMLGWFAYSLCASSKFADAEAALDIAGMELDTLRKENKALLHATRTQFRRKGDR